mmetsp:Transcript_18230/g.21045  ORF Transcript_18230/g.21045 Transcript_18230/m.21045 type:complete len:219 (+) Transcript_18230:327-983(+)
MDRSGGRDVSHSNGFGPLIGMDVAVEDDIDLVLDHEGFDVFSHLEHLYIFLVYLERVVDGNVIGEQEPGSYPAIDALQFCQEPFVLLGSRVQAGVAVEINLMRLSELEGIISIPVLVIEGIGRTVHVQFAFFSVVGSQLSFLYSWHTKPNFKGRENIVAVFWFINVMISGRDVHGYVFDERIIVKQIHESVPSSMIQFGIRQIACEDNSVYSVLMIQS